MRIYCKSSCGFNSHGKYMNLSNLWFDNSAQTIDFKTKYVTQTNVKEFIEKGVTVLHQVVDHSLIDKLLETIDDKFLSRDDIYSSYGQTIKSLKDMEIDTPLTKLLDLYVKVDCASEILCCDAIKEFLEIMFSEKAKLFQSLYFKKGSTQCLHQDPTYVVVDEYPHNLIASWIALEDVKEGSGELVYIEGSHRKLIFRYKNNKIHWNVEEDGHVIHDHHLYCLREMAKELSLTQYLPRKGDVLFWHAGLVHGGSPIKDPTLTRHSIVGHYCPVSCNPRYYNFDTQRYASSKNDIEMISMYYKNM